METVQGGEMAAEHKPWNLFKQQPIVLFHPELQDMEDGGKVYLAGVARHPYYTDEIVLFNADYIISSNMPGGQLGSGFASTPVKGEPVFDAKSGMWILQHVDTKQIYRMALPDERELAIWENVKQYVPSIRTLRKRL